MEKTIYLSINPGIGAELIQNGDERSHTDEDCSGKRYRQKKKSGKKSRGGKHKSKKYSNQSDSNRSDADDERGEKPQP